MPRPHFPSGEAAHGVATKRTTQSFPSGRHSLSIFNSNHPIMSRGRLLASAAAVAITASLAVGGSIMSASTPSIAAAVDTSNLQTSSQPSFAMVVDRVKPAVVSVKVNIEEVAS